VVSFTSPLEARPGTEKSRSGAPGGAFPPQGKGDASQASRAIAPIAQEVSQTSAFPGAPLPSLFYVSADLKVRRTRRRSNNAGDDARLPFSVIARSESDEAIQSQKRKPGLLRCARNDS